MQSGLFSLILGEYFQSEHADSTRGPSIVMALATRVVRQHVRPSFQERKGGASLVETGLMVYLSEYAPYIVDGSRALVEHDAWRLEAAARGAQLRIRAVAV